MARSSGPIELDRVEHRPAWPVGSVLQDAENRGSIGLAMRGSGNPDRAHGDLSVMLQCTNWYTSCTNWYISWQENARHQEPLKPGLATAAAGALTHKMSRALFVQRGKPRRPDDLALRTDEAREFRLLRIAPGLHAKPLLIEVGGLHGERDLTHERVVALLAHLAAGQ